MRFLLLVLFSSMAFAHQTSVTSGGSKLRWTTRTIPVAIVPNSSSLTTTDANNIILQSLNEWNSSTTMRLQNVSSSSNEIRFERDFSMYGSAVVGVTELSYSSSGVIQKAVVRLNEQNYQFSASPGFQPFGRIYLGDVVSHELGHFFGLSHSEVLNSTMFYSTYPGQSSLSPDDKAGIRAKYDTGYGTIYGYIKGGHQIGVLGAHVQAISLKTGESIAALSDETGYFEIGGLDLNDTYYLYSSPLRNLNSLPGYFANVQNNFCPGLYVGSFFTACGRENDGAPQGITLTSSRPSVNIGVMTINCTVKSNADYDYEKVQSSFTEVNVFNYAYEARSEKAFVGYFRSGQVTTGAFSSADKLQIDLRNYTDLGGTTKYLKVDLISQSLGTPLEYYLDIKQGGISVGGTPLTKSLRVPEGSYNLDLHTLIPLSLTANQNLFDVEIKAKKLSVPDLAYSIPAYTQFSSSQSMPYLVVMSLYTGASPILHTDAILSDNSSCLDAPFTYAVTRAKSLSHDDAASEAAPAAAACGTIDPPSSGPSSGVPLIALGFMLAALVSQLAKRTKNFLS